jgi:Citrate lyase, alpha subunit
LDVQDFDKGAAASMASNENQQEIDSSWYADPYNKGAAVNQLDVCICQLWKSILSLTLTL